MDGTLSGPVRDYFAENAMHWIEEYHLDGLRLDATHAIVDDGPQHAVAHIAQAAHEALEGSNRRVYLIAEDHRNLASIVKSVAVGGWGLDGVWADDFHHQLRVALTGDHDGYFQDFEGSTASIAETARKGWFYSGQHASFFGGQRGSDPEGLAYKRFVFFLQNHDQIGNRAFGERLHHTIDLAAYRAVSALLLLLPETPLLFMGQEWAASTPFLYFTNHNAQLGRRVTEGRRREFSRFRAFADPEQWERIPDPQAQGSFEASKLRWDEREREPHASMLRFYRSLLALRRSGPAWTGGVSGQLEIEALSSDVLTFSRDGGLRVVIRLRGSGTTPIPSDSPWTTVWSSEDPAWTNDPNAVQVAVASVYFSRPGAVVLRDARISIGWENR
jgi:maltooligosyltrehalose trehalohydrolase